MIEALNIAILCFDADFTLVQQNPKAEQLFAFELGMSLPDCFGTKETRGTIRRLSRGQTPSFTIEHHTGVLIEFVTSQHDGQFILQGFVNNSLKETRLLLENYSVNLEKQNHQISGLLDQALWLQTSIEQAVRPIFTVDTDFNLQFMNLSAQRIFAKNHKIFGTLIPEIFTEELIGLSLKALPIFEDVREQRSFSVQFNIESRHFECHAKRVVKNEETLGFCVEIEDITGRQAKAKELARMQDMIEGMSRAAMLCDEQCIIQYINPSCMALLLKEELSIQTITNGSINTVAHLLGQSIESLLTVGITKVQWGEVFRYAQTHFELGSTIFNIEVHSLKDHLGAFSGYVLEWEDRTSEEEYRKEFKRLETALTSGQLDVRANSEKLNPFYQDLIEGQNHLIELLCGPLIKIKNEIAKLAEGNLNSSLSGNYSGELLSLQQEWNHAMRSLSALTHQAHFETNKTTDIIHHTNQSLTTINQSASKQLQHSGTLVQELSTLALTNKSISEGIGLLCQQLSETVDGLGQISSQMNGVVNSIQVLESINKEINTALEFIDDLAQQTSILSLNATIEAARVGEAGRGFAVVAKEVKSLAQSSKKVANQSSELLKASKQQIQSGVERVSNLQDNIEQFQQDIVQQQKRSSDLQNQSELQVQQLDEAALNVTNAEIHSREISTALVEINKTMSIVLNNMARLQEQLVVFDIDNTE